MGGCSRIGRLVLHMCGTGTMTFFAFDPEDNLPVVEIVLAFGCQGNFIEIGAVAFEATLGNRAVEDSLRGRVAGTVGPYTRRCKIGNGQLGELVVDPVQVALSFTPRTKYDIK